MRWTKVVLAAGLALSAAPAMADGAPRATRLTQEQRDTWLAERARLAAELPAGAVPARDSIEDWGWYAYLNDAGDLDGDGKGDFIDLRSHLTYDDTVGYVEEVRLDAYRGFDGKALWSRQLPPAAFVYPVLTKVGADGKPGVLVLSFREAGDGTSAVGAGAYDTTITSLNGSGVPLWTTPLDGVWAGSDVGYAYSDHYFEGLLNAVRGGGTDVLIQSTVSGAASDPLGLVYEGRDLTQYGVIDGATGAVKPVGTPVLGDAGGSDADPAGDLTKDGLDDAVIETWTDTGPTLAGLSTGDGRTLWTIRRSFGDSMESLTPLPDVTGDGAADLALTGYSFGAPGKPVPRGQAEKVSLVDGATGKIRWSKPGTRLFALGNIDKKAGAEVAVGSALRAPYSGFTVGAYNGAGKRFWTTTRKLRTGDERNEFRNSVTASSDVHGDGVNDIGYAVVGKVGKKTRRDEGLVNGRTGRVLRDPRPGMYLSRAALDGRGTDAYLATTRGGVLTFEAWRGDTGTRLWTTSLRVRGEFEWTEPASVDGDKCEDIALSLVGDSSVDVVLSGATGTPLWTLTRTEGDTGQVGKAAVTRRTVHRKTC